MYHWRIKPLKAELQRGVLASHQAMRYLTGLWMLFTIGACSYWMFPVDQVNAWDYGIAVASAFAVPIGIRAAYQANGGAEGIDFLGRFHALGWVVGWRVVLPLLALAMTGTVAYDLITGLATTEDAQNTNFAEFSGTVICQVLYYWRLCVHMRDVAQVINQDSSTTAAQPPNGAVR